MNAFDLNALTPINELSLNQGLVTNEQNSATNLNFSELISEEMLSQEFKGKLSSVLTQFSNLDGLYKNEVNILFVLL